MNDTTNTKPKGAGKSSFELIDANKLADNLPLKKGLVILDLACGRGAYSLHMSEIVGDEGLIYAMDLWDEGLLQLDKQIEEQNITNILPLHVDATIPEQIDIDDYSIDICMMATVLHDFKEANQTEAVLKEVKRLLKPNGCLAIIEFKKMEGPPGPPIHIRLSENEVEKLVTGYGFEKSKVTDIGKYNYVMTFRSI
ncbi:MAG: methyltransferase domain-containing protein [Proteobacteria bacterium]|nr:methyltransferase domain-containing protein [Pseudomonadota bacterium]